MAPFLSQDKIKAAEAVASTLGTNGMFTFTHSQLQLVNVTIRQPGLIKIRAVRGNELIRLGTLEIA